MARTVQSECYTINARLPFRLISTGWQRLDLSLDTNNLSTHLMLTSNQCIIVSKTCYNGIILDCVLCFLQSNKVIIVCKYREIIHILRILHEDQSTSVFLDVLCFVSNDIHHVWSGMVYCKLNHIYQGTKFYRFCWSAESNV